MVEITGPPRDSSQGDPLQSPAGPPELAVPPTDLPAPPVAAPHRRQPQLAIGPDTGIDSEALTQSAVAAPHDLASSQSGGVGFDPGAAELEAPPLPADPAQVWQSETSRRVSQFGLVLTLGLFGLIAATVAFVQFARSWNQATDPTLAVAAPSSDIAPPETDPANDIGPPAGDEDSAAQQTSTENLPLQPADEFPATEPVIADLGESVDDTPTSPVAPQPAIEPAQVDAPVVRTPDAPAPTGLDDLPAGLRKFVPLLDLSTADIGPPQLFDPPPTIDSIQLDAAAGEEIEEEPTIKRPTVDVSRALAMRFAIDNRGATLAELTLLLSQLTGVAVELELISLDLAGISATATLETPTGWMTVQQWLDRALAPQGLAAEVVDQRVLIYATPQKLAQVGSAALRLDDFGDSAEEVAKWIQPVAGPIISGALPEQGDDAPAEADAADEPVEAAAKPAVTAAWEFIAAEKRLAVPVDRAALVRAILSVEAARRIHGLPGRLPRWQTERWIGKWSQPPADGAEQGADDAISDWPAVSDGTAGPTLDSPRAIAGLLRQLSAANQVAVVVAWADALRHQLYPTDLTMPYTENLSAGVVLDELVGEAGLQARHAGGSVWWIGSEANYDRYEVITWIAVPAGSGEAIAQRLAQALGVMDPTELPVTWNETTLLVRAPRYIARQLHRFLQS